MAKYLDENGLSRLVVKTKEYADNSSAAVKTAVDGYTVNGKKISTNPTITKADVGLANVDNVKQIPASEKGTANGVATLGTDGKLTAAQMPAMKTVNGESVVGSGDIKIDLSLYKVVTDLPTSDIDATKVYLKLASSTAEKNVYAEYIYTGDTTAAYDASKWEKLGEAQTSITVDAALSTSSTNPVQNKVVNSAIEGLKTSVGNVQSELNSNVQALQGKNAEQDKEIAKKLNASAYVIDAALNATSTNPVQNKAVNTALANKLDKSSYVVDAALSASSANPVQNKVVNTALGQKVNTSTFNTEMAKKLDKTTKASDTVLGLVQTGHIASDGELPLKVDSDGKGYVVIESMSTEDIDALFK